MVKLVVAGLNPTHMCVSLGSEILVLIILVIVIVSDYGDDHDCDYDIYIFAASHFLKQQM